MWLEIAPAEYEWRARYSIYQQGWMYDILLYETLMWWQNARKSLSARSVCLLLPGLPLLGAAPAPCYLLFSPCGGGQGPCTFLAASFPSLKIE